MATYLADVHSYFSLVRLFDSMNPKKSVYVCKTDSRFEDYIYHCLAWVDVCGCWDIAEDICYMYVWSYQRYTYKRGVIRVGTAKHNIIDAFSYPLTKCVAVATYFVNGQQKALQSEHILLTANKMRWGNKMRSYRHTHVHVIMPLDAFKIASYFLSFIMHLIYSQDLSLIIKIHQVESQFFAEHILKRTRFELFLISNWAQIKSHNFPGHFKYMICLLHLFYIRIIP